MIIVILNIYRIIYFFMHIKNNYNTRYFFNIYFLGRGFWEIDGTIIVLKMKIFGFS